MVPVCCWYVYKKLTFDKALGKLDQFFKIKNASKPAASKVRKVIPKNGQTINSQQMIQAMHDFFQNEQTYIDEWLNAIVVKATDEEETNQVHRLATKTRLSKTMIGTEAQDLDMQVVQLMSKIPQKMTPQMKYALVHKLFHKQTTPKMKAALSIEDPKTEENDSEDNQSTTSGDAFDTDKVVYTAKEVDDEMHESVLQQYLQLMKDADISDE